MFETIEQTLSLLGNFTVIGFFLGSIYNCGRFIRLIFPNSKALTFMTDLIFIISSALIIFAFSVELGSGAVRLYYFAAALFGFAIYSVTLGLLTPAAARLIKTLSVYAYKAMYRTIIDPLIKLFGFIKQKTMYIFIIIHKNILKIAEKCILHLKKVHTSLYNKKDLYKIEKLSSEGGEGRNVIVAKVRKSS